VSPLLNRCRHISCGELKGGIDPAGADEHWKTAVSAFRRITTSFGIISVSPPILFYWRSN
jgi:type II restriction enzyme